MLADGSSDPVGRETEVSFPSAHWPVPVRPSS